MKHHQNTYLFRSLLPAVLCVGTLVLASSAFPACTTGECEGDGCGTPPNDAGTDTDAPDNSCTTENVTQCAGPSSTRTCKNGQWIETPCPALDPALCNDNGGCVNACDGLSNRCVPRSCQARNVFVCGPDGLQSCCASAKMPGGSSALDNANSKGTATTMTEFALDIYEINVPRFRLFVESGMGTQAKPPSPGEGAHPSGLGGWQQAWNASLAADQDAFKAAIACDAMLSAYGTPDSEAKPINCLTWYEANAFCIWDGGRLPTEAEWSYAAKGGDSLRPYPWGADAPTLDHASFDCNNQGDQMCTLDDIFEIGQTNKGIARWGHFDMAGNVYEWTMDIFSADYSGISFPCTDCANFPGENNIQDGRTVRGGAYNSQDFYLSTDFRVNGKPTDRFPVRGARCARSF